MAEALYVDQEHDVLKISRPVFRNQFYFARFQSANERRLLRPMRAKQAQALNKIGYEKRAQMLEKFNFLSFQTIYSLIKGKKWWEVCQRRKFLSC